MTATQASLTALHTATLKRSAATLKRAQQAIDDLRREGVPINFNTVAARAHVTSAYLYKQPRLRDTIDRLRTTATTQDPIPPASGTDNGVTAVLRARIKAEQAQNKTLKTRIEQLEDQIERLTGQLAASQTP